MFSSLLLFFFLFSLSQYSVGIQKERLQTKTNLSTSPSHATPRKIILNNTSRILRGILENNEILSLSLALSLSHSLSLILSPGHTHITSGEQSQNLKLASPKRGVSEDLELRDVLWREKKKYKDMLCFSGDGTLKTWCTPSGCFPSFVFLCLFYFILFFRFRFKGNREKRSDHGS